MSVVLVVLGVKAVVLLLAVVAAVVVAVLLCVIWSLSSGVKVSVICY